MSESKKDIAPAHWIGRAQTCAILGVTYISVHRLERRGKLHPKYSPDGYVKYDPAEVENFARTYVPKTGGVKGGRPRAIEGLEADVTKMILDHASPAEIVAKLRVSYDFVQSVYHKSRLDFDPDYVSEAERKAKQEAEAIFEQERQKTERERQRTERAQISFQKTALKERVRDANEEKAKAK